MRGMRALALAAIVAGVFATSYAVDAVPHAAVSVKQAHPVKKPPASDDSCQYAHDNECDEPDIGTGACALGTDYSDCRYLRSGEGDFCRYARDGQCDEPNF